MMINVVTHSTVRMFFILKKETNLFPENISGPSRIYQKIKQK